MFQIITHTDENKKPISQEFLCQKCNFYYIGDINEAEGFK